MSYSARELAALRAHYKNLRDPASFDDFILTAHNGIRSVGVDARQVRMAVNGKKALMELGSRAAYHHVEVAGGINAGFIVSEEDLPKLPELEALDIQRFSSSGGTAFVKFNVSSWDRIPEEMFRMCERGVRLEYERIRAKNLSGIRTDSATTNDALRHAVIAGLGVEELQEAADRVDLIVMNIAWNSNDWKGPSQLPREQIDDGSGATPMESWNFDLTNRRNTKDKIYGYAWRQIQTRLTGDANLVIFHSDGKIVGFYGGAEVLSKPVERQPGQLCNLIANRALSMVLQNKLTDLVGKGYLEDKKRVGDNGFIYLKEPATALRMIDEAIRLNPDQRDELQQLRVWVETGGRSIPEPGPGSELLTSEELVVEQSDRSPMEPSNVILYGPPGTGKTYGTVAHALALVEGVTVEAIEAECRNAEGRAQVRVRYEQHRQEGRIRLVTFHQSFTYEDLVEGIKPKMDDEETEVVRYVIEDGVFKRMAIDASFALYGAGIDETLLDLPFNERYDALLDDVSAKLEAGVQVMLPMRGGGRVEIIEVTERENFKLVHDGGKQEYIVSRNRLAKLYKQFADVAEIGNIYKEFRAVIGGSNASVYYAVLSKLREPSTAAPVDRASVRRTAGQAEKREFFKELLNESLPGGSPDPEQFVLIIDEINRGNVAGIFGELITLIEPDKRLGAAESSTIILPYSKDPFSVPLNLHIIGTMNTADRSVEALDTALRRRFSFIECPSRPELLKGITVEGVALEELLTTINERVEQLLDRDHHIGHSYFMNIGSLDDLKRAFANKVLPLLMEYFHGDARKVGAVLGEAFVKRSAGSAKLARGFDLEEFRKDERYSLKAPMQFTSGLPFKAIYDAEADKALRA
jgi:hypothetical protein